MLRNAFEGLSTEEQSDTLLLVLSRLANVLGNFSPDPSGRLRVSNGEITQAVTGTLSNIGAIGGFNPQYDQYGQMMIGVAAVRNQIQVS